MADLNGQQFQLPGMESVTSVSRPGPQRPAVTPEPVFVGNARTRPLYNGTEGQRAQSSSRDDLQHAANHGIPSINMDSEGVEGVASSGRFKSQFESHHSGGSYDPEFRRDVEHNMFGYPHDLPAHERPIYGHMSVNDSDASDYGPNRAVLHPRVLGRTTMTHNDSLGSGLVPISHADAAVGKVDPAIHGDHYRGDYIEAQFHGGVPASDIDHVNIPSRAEYRHDPARTASQLSAAGIPWRKMHTERYTQPALGTDDEGRFPISRMMAPYGGHTVVNHQQFTDASSPGFKSAWGVSGKPQKGLTATGAKSYTDLVHARRDQEMREAQG